MCCKGLQNFFCRLWNPKVELDEDQLFYWKSSIFALEISSFRVEMSKFEMQIELFRFNEGTNFREDQVFLGKIEFRRQLVNGVMTEWDTTWNDNFFSGWRNAEIMKCFPFLHKSPSISIARSVIFTRYAIPSFKSCRSECSRKKENKQTTFIKIYLTPPVNSGPAGIIFLGFLCQFRWYDP